MILADWIQNTVFEEKIVASVMFPCINLQKGKIFILFLWWWENRWYTDWNTRKQATVVCFLVIKKRKSFALQKHSTQC